MGLFKNLRTRKDVGLMTEEKLYEYVAEEIEAGIIRKGLWAKATVEAASTSEVEIRKKYIELRVDFLRAQVRLYGQILSEGTTALDQADAEEQEEEQEEEKRTQDKLEEDERGRMEERSKNIVWGAFFLVFFLALLLNALKHCSPV